MKGKWHCSPYYDYKLKKYLVTLELDSAPMNYDTTKDMLLSVDIKEYKQKRSLNANAYFHWLAGELAKARNLTMTEVKNQLISDYGYIDFELGTIILKDDINWLRLETIHLQPTSATRVLDDGNLYRVYYIMRGSHTYNTKEMSKLINGTVSEAKEQGIETLDDIEIRRLVEQWKAS